VLSSVMAIGAVHAVDLIDMSLGTLEDPFEMCDYQAVDVYAFGGRLELDVFRQYLRISVSLYFSHLRDIDTREQVLPADGLFSSTCWLVVMLACCLTV
jgi:hypothetical protein